MLGALILAAQVAGAPSPCPPPALDAAAVREWSQNSVLITGRRTGAGLVVGWGEGEAWIAVPSHVIFDKDNTPDDPSTFLKGLSVFLTGNTPAPFCRNVRVNPRPPQGNADLAFVCVEWKGTPVFNSGLIAGSARAGDELRLVGPKVVRSVQGRLAHPPTEQEIASGNVVVQSLVGAEGESGASIVSPAGIIGLYRGHDKNGAMVPIETIRTDAREGEVPWNLYEAEFYDCNVTRRVCAIGEGTVMPASVVMNNHHVSISRMVLLGGCSDVPEGAYQILASAEMTCEPKNVTVLRSSSALNVTMRCAPHMGGTWKTGDGDTLVCAETDIGLAQCGGLGHSSEGFFQGTLSGRGNRISVTGGFVAGPNQYPASGELTWAPGHLTGTIQRQQNAPRTISLTRMEDQ